MKSSKLFLFLVPALLLACASTPPAVEPIIEEEPPTELIITAEPEPATDGRPVGTYPVTQETYDQTMIEVQAFIESLNRTIRRSDFSGWRNACSEEYFRYVSSREFLDLTYSKSSKLQRTMPRLRDVNAYFSEVVVPSRTNSRVDEITFEAEDRVKAWWLYPKDRNTSIWMELYNLIRIGDEWKILSSVNYE